MNRLSLPLLLVIFFQVFSMGAQAQVCNSNKTTSVDLRTELGPIRDQDSVGWCYAFTASDLLGHYLLKTGLSKNKENLVSPLGLAAWYSKQYERGFYPKIQKMNSQELASYKLKVVPEAGTIDEALDTAYQNGYCTEKDAPSESFTIVLEKICSERNLCAQNLKELLELIYDNAGDRNKVEKSDCNLRDVVKVAYPTIDETLLNKIIAQASRESIFYDLAAASCAKKINLNQNKKKNPYERFAKHLSYVKSPQSNEERIFSLIDQQLEHGSIVGIGYYADFLLDPNAKETGPHASSLVGKFTDPITCEVKYILRNSWGPSCEQYQSLNQDFWTCRNSLSASTIMQKWREYKNKKDEASRQYQEAEAMLAQLDSKDPAVKQYEDQMNKALDTEMEMEKYLEIYNDPSSALAKDSYCQNFNKSVPRNPSVICDAKSGYLYISKADLKKYLIDISYLSY